MSNFPDQNFPCHNSQLKWKAKFLKVTSRIRHFFFLHCGNGKINGKNIYVQSYWHSVSSFILFTCFFLLLLYRYEARSYECEVDEQPLERKVISRHKEWHRDFLTLLSSISRSESFIYDRMHSQKVVKIYRLVPWITVDISCYLLWSRLHSL